MLKGMLEAAKRGENVFITDVRNSFRELGVNGERIIIELDLIKKGDKRYFDLIVPDIKEGNEEEVLFVASYIRAEIYNMLSSLGGCGITIYFNTENMVLNGIFADVRNAFCMDEPLSERTGYGNCMNVIDRMIRAIHGEGEKFQYVLKDSCEIPESMPGYKEDTTESDMLRRVTENLGGKQVCGIDIGGTDIKIALAGDGDISCFKEYDWNPKEFTVPEQLIDPILYLTRLVRAYYSAQKAGNSDLLVYLDTAMDKHAALETIVESVEKAEEILAEDIIKLDAVGLSFPDVVVRDKIVGGETTKTRGMKLNPAIDYEKEFAKITALNDRLLELCNKGGAIKNMNDGPAAAYTAAVEMMAANPASVRNGVFAHSLGTELGTGWVDGAGRVPEMPLECYNFIIDLGDFVEKAYPSEDVRSINNVNTGLAGTLQKYTSQSGVFRLAMQYFREQRPKLYKELFDLGFVREADDGMIIVPTSPKDMRKGFLEHVMGLTEREDDELVNEIFRQIGVYLAITWFETEYILEPACKERTLFGRVVKMKKCFDLIKEGAKSRKADIVFELADGGIANTPLMKQLEADKHYTVAQFAQAVGVIYFGNQGLLEKSGK
ncbi:MAG TPA: hypothetical protein PLP30_09620 [Clostridia bacterium]|nr:hypothetical protein [Clostridia bacterium]HPQ47616.1 hypothetical protein [Clostridia bacterium]